VEEARERHKTLTNVIKEKKALSAARKKRMKELIIFWSNFSHVAIKYFLYVLYIAGGVLALWGTTILVPLLISGIGYLFGSVIDLFGWAWSLLTSFDLASLMPYLILAGKITAFSSGVLLTGATTATIFIKLQTGQKIIRVAVRSFDFVYRTCLTPVGHVFLAFFRVTGKVFVGVREFVEVFYEENCPEIKIVDEEKDKDKDKDKEEDVT